MFECACVKERVCLCVSTCFNELVHVCVSE